MIPVERVTSKVTNAFQQVRDRFRIKSDDVFVVSYPKSGNTWVRFLLGNLIKRPGDEVDFHSVHDYVPEFSELDRRLDDLSGPRCIKSHETYNSLYPRVVYIVRDGRDVYVSYYHYLRNRLPDGVSFADFLSEDTYRQGSWGKHVASWLDPLEHSSRLLLVRYEDLLADCAAQVHRLVDFVGLDATEEEIQASVRNSSFDSMRRLEEQRGRAYASNDKAERFVRKGKAGNWKDVFGEQEKEIFKRFEGGMLQRLGYESTNDW